MKNTLRITLALLMIALTGGVAYAAGPDLGAVSKQATNWTAIIMFGAFVAITLWITKWAAAKTKSAADFYTAGGGITGFQNGLAIAGDYMSAASFLGISGLVFGSGFDGLIFSIGWLVGWPVITFLMAERLRNLGKFTFADVAGYRFDAGPIRSFAACGSLVTRTEQTVRRDEFRQAWLRARGEVAAGAGIVCGGVGYRLLQEIGRGEISTVHLAMRLGTTPALVWQVTHTPGEVIREQM